MLVLTTVFALLIAPLIVALTHATAAIEAAAFLADGSPGHGHPHSKAGDDRQDGPLGGHNPTDHEHHLQALVHQAVSAQQPLPGKAQRGLAKAFRHLAPDGPKRPPRNV